MTGCLHPRTPVATASLPSPPASPGPPGRMLAMLERCVTDQGRDVGVV